jgi:23S rRNA C2498 (ribose-2'-O)-methylase RlmM
VLHPFFPRNIISFIVAEYVDEGEYPFIHLAPWPYLQHVPGVSWLVCDVACYPDRLIPMLQCWIARSPVRRVVCTLKLQGRSLEDRKKQLSVVDKVL